MLQTHPDSSTARRAVAAPMRPSAGPLRARVTATVVAACLLLTQPHFALGQQPRAAQDEAQLINWYYSAVFGTGVYKAGDRTVTVLQLPFGHTLRKIDEDNRVGLRLRVPVSFGFYNFDVEDIANTGLPGRINTVSVFPGVEAEFYGDDNWRLRPYANVGYAWDTAGGSDSAAIYATGIKSLLTLPLGRAAQLSLGNQLTWSGYRPASGPAQPLGLFVAGLNLALPSGFKLRDRATTLDFHLIYYYYFNRLQFPLAQQVTNRVREEGEFAISLATRTPVDLKLFDIDRVGLAVRVGADLTAVRLFFNLPY